MNYQTTKTSNLLDLAKTRGLNIDSFKTEHGAIIRQALCDALRAQDIQDKKPIDVVMESNEATGDIKSLESIEKKAVQVIFYSMEENDMPYVQLGLNGKGFYIPKEVEVWIPHELVEGCLRNAVMDKMVMDIDHKGNIRYKIKKVPRFQYSILDIKTMDELDVMNKEEAQSK